MVGVVGSLVGAASQAVVSTMKLPFLSWHLRRPSTKPVSQIFASTPTPTHIDRLGAPSDSDTQIASAHNQLGRTHAPSEPPLHGPASYGALALSRVLDLAVVLHQVQQLARAQVDSLASGRLAFLAIGVDLDLHRQLRRGETVARRCHSGSTRLAPRVLTLTLGDAMSEAATGRRMLGEIEEASLDEVCSRVCCLSCSGGCLAVDLNIIWRYVSNPRLLFLSGDKPPIQQQLPHNPPPPPGETENGGKSSDSV